MVRITRCPICSKINKIKHSHYNNFVCCSTKFPISEYQLNIIPKNPSKELEITENDTNDTNDTKAKETEEIEEEEFDFICAECKCKFNEEGNRNFFGGIKCPNCGLVSYEF